jgi:hypothetical protein
MWQHVNRWMDQSDDRRYKDSRPGRHSLDLSFMHVILPLLSRSFCQVTSKSNAQSSTPGDQAMR